MNIPRKLFKALLISLLFSSSAHAASLVIDQVGAPHRGGGYTGGKVYQSFTPTHTNLAGIDVDFYLFSGTRDLTLKVGTGLESEVVAKGLTSTLVSMTQSASTCGHYFYDVACQEFRFTPIAITPNQQLFLEFTWDNSGAAGGAIGAARGDRYSGGKVLCTSCGNTSDGDVAFVSYSSVSAVPVPAAALLFAPALAAFVALRRKRRV